MRIVRFTDALLADEVLTVHIENVPVKVFGVAKTIADCFRHRRKVGQTVALEGLQEALRQRRASPAEMPGMRNMDANGDLLAHMRDFRERILHPERRTSTTEALDGMLSSLDKQFPKLSQRQDS